MSQEKNHLIVIYNNGYIRAYNRIPSILMELQEAGIVKYIIDANEMKTLSINPEDGTWVKIGQTTL